MQSLPAQYSPKAESPPTESLSRRARSRKTRSRKARHRKSSFENSSFSFIMMHEKRIVNKNYSLWMASFAKSAVRERADLAIQAQAALAEQIYIRFFQQLSLHDPRNHEVKNRPLCVHHTARKANDRNIVLALVGKHEHSAREHGSSVGDDPVSDLADGIGSPVIRVNAHPAGAQNHVRTHIEQLSDGSDFHRGVVA